MMFSAKPKSLISTRFRPTKITMRSMRPMRPMLQYFYRNRPVYYKILGPAAHGAHGAQIENPCHVRSPRGVKNR
jgi:hypothetical protein